jgi:hypothetical protein
MGREDIFENFEGRQKKSVGTTDIKDIFHLLFRYAKPFCGQS